MFKVTDRKWQSWIQAQVSQLPTLWVFTLQHSDVWHRPEQEEDQEGSGRLSPIAPLGLLLFFPGTTIRGEWLPSGVRNVTCPDKEESWQLACLRSGVG